MLKKTIKHKDLDGNDVETDAYFNLTEAEAIELNIRNDLEVIGRSRNNNEIMDAFKRILQMAYGVRTSDGRFIKVNNQGAPLFYEFSTTEAYSELFMELFRDADYAQHFIKAILPQRVANAMEGAEQQNNQTDIPAHLANHPSMQGHKAAQPTTRREARESAPETPDQMEMRLRQELMAEMQANQATETQSARVSSTPTEAGQLADGYPPRDQLN